MSNSDVTVRLLKLMYDVVVNLNAMAISKLQQVLKGIYLLTEVCQY